MANLVGSIRRTCPYCCEPIEAGQAYEVAKAIGSPIDGMTIHATCAQQRDFASQQYSEISARTDG